MKKLLLPILLFILAIFSFFWYTQPAYDATSDIKDDIEEYDTALSQVNEIQQIRDELLSRHNQLPDSSLYVMHQILPRSLDTVRFLIELDQIAITHGLGVQNISFTDQQQEAGSSDEETVPDKPYESTRVTFSTSGSYEEVLSFLRDVEQSARLMDIVELTVGGDTANLSEEDQSQAEETGFPSGEQNTYSVTADTYWINNEDS